jgi:hypothetical protein
MKFKIGDKAIVNGIQDPRMGHFMDKGETVSIINIGRDDYPLEYEGMECYQVFGHSSYFYGQNTQWIMHTGLDKVRKMFSS